MEIRFAEIYEYRDKTIFCGDVFTDNETEITFAIDKRSEIGDNEIRYNHNHDSKTGRFAPGTSGNSGAGALSAQGENRFTVQMFKSRQKLNNHWQKHGKEYAENGIKTKEQYLKAALKLIQSKTDGNNILGFIYNDGRLARYDVQNNFFATGRPDTGIYTMFKPKEEKAYYDKEFGKGRKRMITKRKKYNHRHDKSEICPVCGKYTFDEPGTYDMCPVCGWFDDPSQYEDPDESCGDNQPYSLNEYRRKWAAGEVGPLEDDEN